MAETTETVEEKTEEQQDQQNQVEQEDSKAQAQSVEFSEAAENKTTGSGASIDILLDMNVPVTVAIGRTEVPIQRLLQLGPGSVLKLDKPIDAPAVALLRVRLQHAKKAQNQSNEGQPEHCSFLTT